MEAQQQPNQQSINKAARRQAAYRRRRQERIDYLLAMRGLSSLPALPAISTIPGWPRWKQAMARIAAQIEIIDGEMTDYYDARSERWQESEQASAFEQNREVLRVLIETARDWPE